MNVDKIKNTIINILGYSNYRKLLVYTMRKITKTNDKILYNSSVFNIKKYSVEGKDTFFGYYDLKSLNSDRSKLLSHVIDGNIALLGYFDTQSKMFTKICTTTAWNWQMGSRLRWYRDGESILFNDFNGEKFISRIVDIRGVELQRFEFPIFDIDIENGNAYFTDFTILHHLREGYGYNNINVNFENYYNKTQNGIFWFNTNSGEHRLLISTQELEQMDSSGDIIHEYNYVNHITINPYNKDIMFFHLWKVRDELKNRMIFINSDGTIINIISDFDRASHYAWKDSNHILVSLYIEGNTEYRLYDYRKSTYELFNGVATDGHPSYIDNRFFITDTYPNRCSMQSIYLCDSKECAYKNIFSIYHLPVKTGALRCDLHPRILDNTINIDSVSDCYRCLYMFDFDKNFRDVAQWGHHLTKNREAIIDNNEPNTSALFSCMKSEYLFVTGRKMCNKPKVLMMFLQDPVFRVNVYIAQMQKSTSKRKRKRIRNILETKYGIVVDQNCKIGKHFRTDHAIGIVIGPGAIIGDYCKIYQNVTIGQKSGKFPRIGNHVTIYPGAKIIGDINVGDYAVVGANAVVTKDVPSGSTAVGIPARIIPGDDRIL